MIKIVIDAMGGDFAPAQQVKGAVEALAKDKELSVVLTGDESAVKAELSKYPYDPSRVEIVHAPEVITNDEVPTKAVKTKKKFVHGRRVSAPQGGQSRRFGVFGRDGRGAYRGGAYSRANQGDFAPRALSAYPQSARYGYIAVRLRGKSRMQASEPRAFCDDGDGLCAGGLRHGKPEGRAAQ